MTVEIQDNLTKYFEELQMNFESSKPALNEAFAESIVGKYGSPVSGHIAQFMSQTFNPNLFMSGQNPNYWQFESKEGMSILEVLYTGIHLHDKYPVGKAKVWSEFATSDTKNKPLQERELARDYAYYQETGIDPIAKSSDAKHKGAIKEGLSLSNQFDLEKTGDYLEHIMRGNKVQSSKFGGYR